jgi:toxin ParE1/3/4
MHVTFSSRAKADVQVIWNYTVEHWGKGQAEIYLRLIGAAVGAIMADPGIGRPCDDVRPGYRKYLVGSHVLFYRATAKAVFVVRILHQRMDVERHF